MWKYISFSSPGISFDFAHFVKRSYPRFFLGFSLRFVLIALLQRAILASHTSSHVSIYRSLISFAVSRPQHLVLHVILISSFITDVIAPPLRGASERCNAFPSYAEEDFAIVSRSVWMSSWSNWMAVIFPFSRAPGLNVSLVVGILNYGVFNRLRSPARKTHSLTCEQNSSLDELFIGYFTYWYVNAAGRDMHIEFANCYSGISR